MIQKEESISVQVLDQLETRREQPSDRIFALGRSDHQAALSHEGCLDIALMNLNHADKTTVSK
jgi:hypothetical protein